jgi:hypothetical protein
MIIDPCPDCPCPGACLRWPVFCRWAAAGDPVLRAHIAARSGVPASAPAVPIVPGAEAIALTRSMGACPYRSTAGCGCGGAACSLRRGKVSHLDCFECLRRFPVR